jgi:hypothetical protein
MEGKTYLTLVRRGVQHIEVAISKPDGIADVAMSLELARVAERHVPIATCASVAAP